MGLLLAGVVIGLLQPMQTAINSRLRRSVGSPLSASAVSFSIGTLGLLVVLSLAYGPSGLASLAGATAGAPAWQWIGGALGVFLLTTNIFAFAHLGAVETALWPVLGSVITSIGVDALAWFGVVHRPLTPLRAAGAAAVLLGIGLASGLLGRRGRGLGSARSGGSASIGSTAPSGSAVPSGGSGAAESVRAAGSFRAAAASKGLWRLVAFTAGSAGAVQGAVNGALGRTIGSPFFAALISFGTGALLIVTIAVIAARRRARSGTAVEAPDAPPVGGAFDAAGPADRAPVRPWRTGPWWMWIGGFFGALYVAVMALAVPRIGAGPSNVAALAGLSVSSICVDRFGWFHASRAPVRPIQIIGVLVLFAGVVGVQFG